MLNRKLQGAWSLVWHTESDNKIRFLRNAERPMCIAKVHEEWSNAQAGAPGYLWASEEWMIQVAAGKARLKVDEIIVPKPGELWEIENTHSEMKLTNVESVKFYEPPHVTRPYYSGVYEAYKDLYDDYEDRPKYSRTNTNYNKQHQQLNQQRDIVFPLSKRALKQYRKRWNETITGLPFGKEIDIMLHEWIPDANDPSVGTYYGIMTRSPWHNVVVNSVLFDNDLINSNVILTMAPLKYNVDFQVENGVTKQKGITLTVNRLDFLDAYADFKAGLNEDSKEEDKEDAPPKEASDIKVMGPGNIMIPLSEFESLTDNGCNVCLTPLNPEDARKVTWVTSPSSGMLPVCLDCMDKARNKGILKN